MSSIVSDLNGAAIGGTESIIKNDGLKHNGLICEEAAVAENGQQNSTGNINWTTGTTQSAVATSSRETNSTQPLNIISTFSGVGGIDEAFRQACYKILKAIELDRYPAMVYNRNFELPAIVDDIRHVDPNDLPRADGIAGGSPCQDYSVAGLRQGFSNPRGLLIFEQLRLAEVLQPKFILIENVKGLVTHDKGRTLATIIERYESKGYKVVYKVLNAKDFGVPQNRERVYIVMFKDIEHYNRFKFPEPLKRKPSLNDVIDFEHPVEDKYYYTASKNRKIYEMLAAAIDDPNAVYQLRRTYVRKNKSGLIPTLTANMGTGGNNVPIIKTKYGIRKLTPRECFNAMGFPKDFILPEDLSDSRLYKMAGNSVCVPVVRRIAENIAQAIS